MPFKNLEKRREYARQYYSSKEQKEKKKIYDQARYEKTKDVYKESRRRHTLPHVYAYQGDWVCNMCSSLNNLVIHHRDGDHSNNDPNNLVCLCGSCHSKVHMEKRKRNALGQVTRE